jgi:translation initiation factor 2B subunit (eIF-2B alpha/beta/delta family)
MSNEENYKNFWKFQQFVKSEECFKKAEEELKTFQHSMDNAVLRVKETGELSDEDYQEYKEMEALLYKVQHFINDQEKKAGTRRIQIARNLENILSGDEN